MNKAILVIDMPSCCDECFALDDNSDYPFCLITHEQKGYKFNPREQKMDKCPFHPMPEKASRVIPIIINGVTGRMDGMHVLII